VLVDRPVQVGPPPGDLDVGLLDEPPVTGGAPRRASGVDELLGEGLSPPIVSDVVDLDAPLSQQLLDIAVGQPIAQLPAHRDPQ